MRLHTLGRLELLPSDIPGAAPLAVQPKRLALLAYLAVATPRGMHRRDVLLGLFWPDLDEDEARRALRQALHHLRRFLGDGVLVSRADESVGLAEGGFWCDATAMEAAVNEDRTADALTIYRGDFLQGCFVAEVSAEFEHWVDQTRSALRRQAAEAARSLARQEEQRGNGSAAIVAARRAMELAPDDEPAMRELIELHLRLEDRAGALRAYQEFDRRLAAEFGVSPSAETAAVIERVRAAPPRAPVEVTAAPQTTVPPPDRIPQAVAAAPSPKPVGRGRRAPAARGGVLLLLAVALSWVIGTVLRRPEPAPAPDLAKLAVLPFHNAGVPPDLAWLNEGVADLLALRLDVPGGPRAVDPAIVLNAARRIGAPAAGEAIPEAALAVARRVGAGQVITGAVAGTATHLTITASLIVARDGRTRARASVEGPADSLPSLVDRLAGRLLSAEAGLADAQIGSLASVPLPAIRSYLAGRAALRGGKYAEASRRFQEATVLDSTFTLAALEVLHASFYVASGGETPDVGRARLALAGRNRLGSGDQALLDLWAHPFATVPELLSRWREAANAYPDRAEIWYGLGDAYYHDGVFAGVLEPFRLAADAFRRGWALDSVRGSGLSNGERSPMLNHMVEIAQMDQDDETVRRLVRAGLSSDSTSAQGQYLRWQRALTEGDSARRAFWEHADNIDPGRFTSIYRFTVWTGIAPEDYRLAAARMIQESEAHDPENAALTRHAVALNGGRPREAARVLASALSAASVSFGLPIREALYWDADTSVASEAARRGR
ncbi:MAG: hypothetical protein H0W67_05295, partial [Gemmatimonadales bacterium]|nr:hypothetical protein [Gemmatimonadales bacterium]